MTSGCPDSSLQEALFSMPAQERQRFSGSSLPPIGERNAAAEAAYDRERKGGDAHEDLGGVQPSQEETNRRGITACNAVLAELATKRVVAAPDTSIRARALRRAREERRQRGYMG